MIRKRLAILAAVAGLGLSLGCSSTNTSCSGGFFSRLCNRTRTTTTNVSEAFPIVDSGMVVPGCEGPLLEAPGAYQVPPTGTYFNGGAPCYGQTPPGYSYPSMIPPVPNGGGAG